MRSSRRILISAIFLVIAGMPLSAQLRPVGLQDKTVISLTAEQGDPGEFWFPITANFIFAAATDGLVYQGRTWDDGKSWMPIGPFTDPPEQVVTLGVQHWGAGPRDGLHLFASLRPRPSTTDSPILLRYEVTMFDPPDSTWVRADSGIVRGDTAEIIYALTATYYTGHTPPQPVLGWTGTTPLRGYPAGVFWETPAEYRGHIVSMDVTPKWYGMDVWAAGATNQEFGDAIVLRSADQGLTWKEFIFPRALNSMAYAVAVASGHPDTAFASIDGAVRRTIDGGASWELVLAPAAGKVIALACDPQNPAHVYAGTDDPEFLLYRSTDLGGSWQRIMPSTGAFPAAITCMIIALLDTVPMGRPARSGLFVGTAGTGVWLYDMSDAPTDVVQLPAADAMQLTFYPNPVREAALVEVRLSAVSSITLELRDLLGRTLHRAEYGERSAGTHAFTLHVGDLPTGTYVVRVANAFRILKIIR
ncbi:MAG: T9SS type A sorting domain-containing protein [Bacteroidota bacterium]